MAGRPVIVGKNCCRGQTSIKIVDRNYCKETSIINVEKLLQGDFYYNNCREKLLQGDFYYNCREIIARRLLL